MSDACFVNLDIQEQSMKNLFSTISRNVNRFNPAIHCCCLQDRNLVAGDTVNIQIRELKDVLPMEQRF